MDINKYILFVDVAETKNFTKSGERLGYTQPGVSHILKGMENELGFPLFLRTTQGVSLTPNAEAILPIVRELLSVNEQLDQTVASINGIKTGHLTIASFASISRNLLPAVLFSFRTNYPGIDIELLEGGTDDIVHWVNESIADFGLLSKRHTTGLEWIPLFTDPLMAILPKHYLSEEDRSFPIIKMADVPFIMSADGTDYDIHYALKDSNIVPNESFSSTDDLAIVSMVANNLGFSILPQLVIEGVENQITAVPLEPFYSRELGIGYRSKNTLAPAARLFIQTLRESLEPSFEQQL